MEKAVVSAATGAMSSVLVKLAELLHEKYKLAKGVRKDIEFLRSELGVMNDLLYVMADIEELDALNKGWRDRVRELAYDVEDCIDRSVARFRHTGGDASKGGFFGTKQLARKFKKIRVSFQIGHQIQELKARVIEESDRQKRYKLDGLIGSSSDASRNKVDLRMCALWEETKNLVGLNGPMDEVIRLLMPAEGEMPSQQVRTLSIVGCAGLGKTTLANQVYQKIQGHFECKAFVPVSQNPNIKDILMKICSQVGATPSMADDEFLLVNKLRERLQYKRILVNQSFGSSVQSCLPLAEGLVV
ncbi:putative disease resistance RPP13-like protein 3 [Setaria italica]|uniref:putative disease resistance RPP13-like protein 3 n=1 Tax=Setaria italica TaxID=4555 RepID=UPI000350B1CF|nr:putative disease resistance RPP13-like protein 3 [Setaria italica]